MKPLLFILICAALLAGCEDSGARRDAADEKNTYVQNGLEQAQLKRWDEAIRQFKTALENNPALARPDLELALIYHQQKKNYIRAIYHYEHYLEKRPDSEKARFIADWIRQAKISFAGQIGQSAGDISEELIRLTRENNMLRKQIENGSGTTMPVAHVKTVMGRLPPKAEPKLRPPIVKAEPTPATRKPVQRIQPPAPTHRTYKVLPGDTLSRIAKVIYGDSRNWKKIYAANMDKMKNENDLKAGQIIILPTLGN